MLYSQYHYRDLCALLSASTYNYHKMFLPKNNFSIPSQTFYKLIDSYTNRICKESNLSKYDCFSQPQ